MARQHGPFSQSCLKGESDLDRFHIVMDVIDRVPGLGSRAAHVRQRMVDARLRARQYTRAHGEDAPEVRDWVWPY